MKNIYKILITFCILASIFVTGNVYAASYPAEYEKYVGTYYWEYSSSSDTSYKSLDTYKLFSTKGNITITQSRLDNAIDKDKPAVSGGRLRFVKYTESELTELLKTGEILLSATAEELVDKYEYKEGTPIYVLTDDYKINITDGSGVKLATIPTYKVVQIFISDGGKKVTHSYELTATSDIKTLIAKIDTGTSVVQKNEFWGSAASWFGGAKDEYNSSTHGSQIDDIVSEFTGMINVVGTTVIVIATIVLGIRYIIGGADNQASAKEGLITLFVACIFFFGWTSISNLLYGGEAMDFIFTDENDLTYENMVGRIFSTFTYIAQFIVVGAIIYVGVKYIFAGASGRAELKGKSVYFIIGIILVFATSNVLSFVSDIINETVAK